MKPDYHTFFPKLKLAIFLFLFSALSHLPSSPSWRPPQPKQSTRTCPVGFTGVSSNLIKRQPGCSVENHSTRLSLKSAWCQPNRETAKMAAESATNPTQSRNRLLCGLASTPGGLLCQYWSPCAPLRFVSAAFISSCVYNELCISEPHIYS